MKSKPNANELHSNAWHPRDVDPSSSYYWVKEQRKLSLARAFTLLKQPDGTLAREDYVQLMARLRPDCDQEHVSEKQQPGTWRGLVRSPSLLHSPAERRIVGRRLFAFHPGPRTHAFSPVPIVSPRSGSLRPVRRHKQD